MRISALRHDISRKPLVSGLTAALLDARQSAEDDARFPAAAFELLKAAGVTAHPPIAPGEIEALLRLLAEIGRGDLSVGRIFEGHANALLLIRSFGSSAQIRTHQAEAESGALFGVWNTDLPADPLRLEGGELLGKKSFATGIDGLDYAIVTVTQPEGRRMIVVPLRDVGVDRGWWRPTGMRTSGSHVVDFTGLKVQPEWMLGSADDYIRQPWFSAGAIRFAAVQVGGMHAVFDQALTHLGETGRAANPYQRHRLGRMAVAVETGYAWLERAARAWKAASLPEPAANEEVMAAANATRHAVETAALAVLEDAERGVGAAGFIAPHPLERSMRDLRTYLRQPNPDGALEAVGAAVTDAHWRPGESFGTLGVAG